MERFNQLQFGCLIAKFYLPTKGDTSNSEHSHHIEMAMTMQELEDFIRAKEKDVRHTTVRGPSVLIPMLQSLRSVYKQTYENDRKQDQHKQR